MPTSVIPHARAIARALLVTTAILLAGPAAHADTVWKKLRFDAEGGTTLNPFTFEAGKGPQAFLTIGNTGDKARDFGVEIVLETLPGS